MTLRAIKLIVSTELHTGQVTPREVVKVLELVADDGYWPLADPNKPGANYFSKKRPYEGGTHQHMDQMSWKNWLNHDLSTHRFKLGEEAPDEPALAKKYLRLVADVRGQRPEPAVERGEASKRCVVCRRSFRSRLWTCGDPMCAALVPVSSDVMVRREGLESQGLAVVFDVNLRSQQRFVQVETSRGTWRTNALKWETWAELLERACGV